MMNVVPETQQQVSESVQPENGFAGGGDASVSSPAMGNHAGELSLLALPRRVVGLPVRLMQFMLGTLRNTDRPMPSYVWRALCIVYVATLTIDYVVAWLSGLRVSWSLSAVVADLFCTWRFWMVDLPLRAGIETLVMWPILFPLRRFLGNSIWVPLLSGMIWGVLHSLELDWSPIDGLRTFELHWLAFSGPAWGFFVFSVCFLEWEKKSKKKAFLVTWLLHTCSNVVTFLLQILVWTLSY